MLYIERKINENEYILVNTEEYSKKRTVTNQEIKNILDSGKKVYCCTSKEDSATVRVFNTPEDVLKHWVTKYKLTKGFEYQASTKLVNDVLYFSCDGYGNSLEKWEVPDFFTMINTKKCEYMDALTEIIIPESVSYICNNAFSSCWQSRIRVEIQGALKVVEGEAFLSECADYIFEFSNTVQFSANSYIGHSAFRGGIFKNDMKLYDGTSYIGYMAFSDAVFAMPVDLPDNTVVDTYAFSESYGIKELTIGKRVTLAPYAFASSRSLTKVVFRGQINELIHNNDNFSLYLATQENIYTYYEKYLKHRDEKLSIVENTLISSQFERCDNLEEVILPESLLRYSPCVFEECARLKHISIPKKAQVIETEEYDFGVD